MSGFIFDSAHKKGIPRGPFKLTVVFVATKIDSPGGTQL